MLIAASVGSLLVVDCATGQGVPNRFTRLEQVPAPKIVASTAAYPGGSYNVGNIIDGQPKTEYSSDSKGTDTFIEFDLGAPTPVAAFRHVDRNDPATIASSELTFLDDSGDVVSTVPVKHVNQRGGITFLTLPSPVTARRVRWQVTGLGTGLRTVGGAEIAFFTAGQTEARPSGITIESQSPQLLRRNGAALVRPLKITLNYPYAEPVPGMVHLAGSRGQGAHFEVRQPERRFIGPRDGNGEDSEGRGRGCRGAGD